MSSTELTYTAGDKDQDRFLREILFGPLALSHSLVVRLKHQGRIKVNGQRRLTNYQVQAGDIVSIDLDFIEDSGIIPEPLPLDIVYEDQDLLAVNKPAGMSIHPSRRGGLGTLANAVAHYWQGTGRHTRYRPVHRLDKDTSGLVLIGGSQYAHQGLFQQQQRRGIERVYTALVEGVVKREHGSVDRPIARLEEKSRRRTVHPDGQPATTHYRVLERYPGHTLLEVSLETGRTHQIRVHLSFIGHPVCGDPLYGPDSPLIGRQALHAGRLRFTHPRTGERLELSVPLPEDMRQAIEQLKDPHRKNH
ncbi:MAG: RluA family pseudouridine synthase [Firmicutes bacterium]|nr:RluA family pseudouridine synthase [Bacillota bacterium]